MPDGKLLIDSLRSPDGGLSREAVRSVLPYGEDFLFVDRVVRLSDEQIEALYKVPADSLYIRSHFEDFPLMPGALIAEGFAQAGTVLIRYRLPAPQDTDLIGMQIESARFSAPAFPGDTLIYRARLTTLSRRAARLEGDIRVEEREVGKMRIVVGIVDRRAYRAFAKRR